MLMFYALEDHSRWFILAFAGACVLSSAYGFMQGAWPFGIIEAIWAGVAVRRWRIGKRVYEHTPLHVNYSETKLPIRDGLLKLKDFPHGFGGSGIEVVE